MAVRQLHLPVDELRHAGLHTARSRPLGEVASAKTAPVLTRRQTCRLTKCSGEIGLAGEAQCESDIDQRTISSCQQCFGTLEALRTDVLMRWLAHRGLECAREMESTQARDPCQPIDRKIAFQVSLDVVHDAGQSASIQPFLCDAREDQISQWAESGFFNQMDNRVAIGVQPLAVDTEWRTRALAQPEDGAKGGGPGELNTGKGGSTAPRTRAGSGALGAGNDEETYAAHA